MRRFDSGVAGIRVLRACGHAGVAARVRAAVPVGRRSCGHSGGTGIRQEWRDPPEKQFDAEDRGVLAEDAEQKGVTRVKAIQSTHF